MLSLITIFAAAVSLIDCYQKFILPYFSILLSPFVQDPPPHPHIRTSTLLIGLLIVDDVFCKEETVLTRDIGEIKSV